MPVTDSRGLYEFETPRLPHCLDNRLTDGGSQPYAPAACFTPRNIYRYSILSEAESIPGPECIWKKYVNWKPNDLIWNRTLDLPVCSTVPQPATLPRAPRLNNNAFFLICKYFYYERKMKSLQNISLKEFPSMLFFHLFMLTSMTGSWD
jgi:hypothetical protein